VTFIFKIWAALASISNTLFYVIKMTFSQLISYFLEKLGVDEYLAGLLSAGISLMLVSSIIYFLPNIYRKLKPKQKVTAPGFMNNR
jgi:small basic protein